MIELSDYKEQDMGFLYSSWLHSFWACLQNKGMSKNDFYNSFHHFIETNLSKWTLLFARSEEDKDVIVGYVVFTPNPYKLWWVYVKDDFRKLGVATRLLQQSIGKDAGKRTAMLNGLRISEQGRLYNPAEQLLRKFTIHLNPWNGHG